MTKKPDGHVFLKVNLPPEKLRDFDDALKLHGLHRARNWVMNLVVELFIEETKRMLEAGELPPSDETH